MVAPHIDMSDSHHDPESAIQQTILANDRFMIPGSRTDTVATTKPQVTDGGGPNASAYEPRSARRGC